jgi:hypothetical protein
MRILKALAAVLAGILLLALPAVAMPQNPQAPKEECVTEDEAKDLEEEAKEATTKNTALAEPAEECLTKEEKADLLGEITEGLGL